MAVPNLFAARNDNGPQSATPTPRYGTVNPVPTAYVMVRARAGFSAPGMY